MSMSDALLRSLYVGLQAMGTLWDHVVMFHWKQLIHYLYH